MAGNKKGGLNDFVIRVATVNGTGSASANKRLSQKRADTVRWILVRDYGVNRSDLKAKGFGEKNPVADNSKLMGRMANRRVLIKLVD